MDHNKNLSVQCSNEDINKFQIKFLPPIYGVELCVAFAGNALALWLLVTKERKNWHTGMVLTCNLAISDLLYILTLPLLIAYYALDKNWPFGTFLCTLERFLFTCNLYVSIFLIMCISVNRYVAIVHPFFTRTYVRTVHAKTVSIVIWVLVAAISSPVLKFATTCSSGNVTRCVSHCNAGGDAQYHLTYTLFLAGFGCFVPFIITFASYCAVVWVVWKNENITPLEKRKVALMVLSGVVLYAVSFLPYNVFQSYYYYLLRHGEHEVRLCQMNKAYQVSKGLAGLNMCIHPLLYMAVFDSIRVACCGRSQNDISTSRAKM